MPDLMETKAEGDIANFEVATSEPVEVVKINAIAKPKTKLKTTGGASDLFEIAETGKPKSKKVHQIYRKSDSVEDMAKSTVDLMADSTRVVLKEFNDHENDKLSNLVNKNYSPRKTKTDDESDLNNVLDSLHLF